jgi:hypothetical protein
MQEQFVSSLEKIIEQSKLNHIRVHSKESTVIITPFIINFRILTDIYILIIAAYGIYTVQDKEFYLIPILFVSAVLLIMIAIDFNPINKIKIDFYSKEIEIRNRNIINRLFVKYILKKKRKFSFKEIRSFDIRSNQSFEIALIRYYIDLKVKDESRFAIISFQKQNQADNLGKILNSLLKS